MVFQLNWRLTVGSFAIVLLRYSGLLIVLVILLNMSPMSLKCTSFENRMKSMHFASKLIIFAIFYKMMTLEAKSVYLRTDMYVIGCIPRRSGVYWSSGQSLYCCHQSQVQFYFWKEKKDIVNVQFYISHLDFSLSYTLTKYFYM